MRLVKSAALGAIATLATAAPAFAQEVTHVAASGDLAKFAGGLAIAIAALGGALGQAKAASAALEGIARNPGAASQMFTPMIIGLVLIESLVIYAFVVALKLVGLF